MPEVMKADPRHSGFAADQPERIRAGYGRKCPSGRAGVRGIRNEESGGRAATHLPKRMSSSGVKFTVL